MIQLVNNYQLGDCLLNCHYLRLAAQANSDKQFQLACKQQYVDAVKPVLSDVPNASVVPLEQRIPEAVSGWIGENQRYRNYPHWSKPFTEFYLDWVTAISNQIGIAAPITCTYDLLFDYPSLTQLIPISSKYDLLVVNSRPQSGQFHYNEPELDDLIWSLAERYRVITTKPVADRGGRQLASTQHAGLSVTAIGALSITCTRILAINTGPSWPTLNKWNVNKEYIMLLGETDLRGWLPSLMQARTLADAARLMEERKW